MRACRAGAVIAAGAHEDRLSRWWLVGTGARQLAPLICSLMVSKRRLISVRLRCLSKIEDQPSPERAV